MQQLLAGMIPVGEDGSFAFRTRVVGAYTGMQQQTLTIGSDQYKVRYTYDGNTDWFVDVTGNVQDKIN